MVLRQEMEVALKDTIKALDRDKLRLEAAARGVNVEYLKVQSNLT